MFFLPKANFVYAEDKTCFYDSQCYKLGETAEMEGQQILVDEEICKNSGGQIYSSYADCQVVLQKIEAPQQTGEEGYKLPEGIEGLNQLGTTDVKQVLGNMIKVAMGIMGSIALVMFIYAGFTMMTGSTVVGGGATKVDISKAKSILVWSALGMIVILASYALVNFVFEAFR